MKIILKKKISGLGKEKDIVEVAEGYARNFLIPKGLALKASSGNLQIIDEEKKKEVRNKEKEKGALKNLSQRIENISCTISARAGADNKLYGSVTSQDIAEALAKEGVQIAVKGIKLAEPIKSLGIYHISVELHPEIKTVLKVWVIKE